MTVHAATQVATLKEDGNRAFTSYQFEKAERLYSQALLAVNADGGDDDSRCPRPGEDGDDLLPAILHSNRSNARFEQGRYAEAAQDARDALRIISSSAAAGSNTPLRLRNLWRLYRCLWHDDVPAASQEKIEELEKLALELADHADYSEKAGDLLEQFKARDRIAQSSGGRPSPAFEPALTRPSLSQPAKEYFPFGHDTIESALRNSELGDDSPLAIRFWDLDDAALSNVRILYGGVGDARHVYGTLLDAHDQLQGLSNNKRNKFHMHITLNDVVAQQLLKDALVLILSVKMARLCLRDNGGDFDRLWKENAAAMRIGTVIYYASFGHAMPRSVYSSLREEIQDIFLNHASYEEFHIAYPWLCCNKDQWSLLVETARYWYDTEKYSPPLRSVKYILENDTNPGKTNMTVDEHMAKVQACGLTGTGLRATSNYMQQQEDNRKKQAKEVRQRLIGQLRDIDGWSDELRASMQRMFGTGHTDQEYCDLFVSVAEKITGDALLGDLASSPECFSHDKTFLEKTHALLPPYSGMLPEFRDLVRSFRIQSNEGATTIQKIKSTLYSEWVANPVRYDPYFHKYSDGQYDANQDNPIKLILEHYLTDDVLSYTARQLSIQYTHDSLADLTIRFFDRVGKALVALIGGGHLSMEISLESIVSYGESLQNASVAEVRKKHGLPSSFHRIYLSNIPDYIGMLTVFTSISPLLAAQEEKIIASFSSGILLNTGIWETYDQYVNSTAALTEEQASRILGLSVVQDEPSVWATAIYWTRNVGVQAGTNGVGPGELKLWLFQLFLSIVLPPVRNPCKILREERPSTVATFLNVCKHLMNHLNYPIHWIDAALDGLMNADPFKTKAVLSNKSPVPVLANTVKMNKYDMSAFRLEMQNELCVWVKTGHLPRQLISSFSPEYLESSPSQYCIHLSNLEKDRCQLNFIQSLGFVLADEENIAFLQKQFAMPDNLGMRNSPFFKMVASMVGKVDGGGELDGLGVLREFIMSSDNVYHVFSCVRFDGTNDSITFWMDDHIFNTRHHYGLALIRTDGWFCLAHDPVSLRDAKKVTMA